MRRSDLITGPLLASVCGHLPVDNIKPKRTSAPCKPQTNNRKILQYLEDLTGKRKHSTQYIGQRLSELEAECDWLNSVKRQRSCADGSLKLHAKPHDRDERVTRMKMPEGNT